MLREQLFDWPVPNEGRRRPSLIAARAAAMPRRRPPSNEGRRRPSLIAARRLRNGFLLLRKQRGAPAPLPHCGEDDKMAVVEAVVQRGAPAPLPHCGFSARAFNTGRLSQRGAPAPLPHCGQFPGRQAFYYRPATRGAGAPPSLRRMNMPGHRMLNFCNEGRRRPSLIAAFVWGGAWCEGAAQRGAPAPLPHCGVRR